MPYPMAAARGRATGAVVAGDWWEVAGETCVAAYQPKGAVDIATSYVNLANPGTNNAAPGNAPTFATATGWTFDGTDDYLATGVVPESGYSLFIAFTGAGGDQGWFIGAYNGTGNNRLSIGNPNSNARIEYGSGKTVDVVYGGSVTSGVLAVAGQQGYRDGSASGTAIAAWDGTITNGIDIGRLNGAGGNTQIVVQAVAIYSTTLDAGQVAALSTLMAAL